LAREPQALERDRAGLIARALRERIARLAPGTRLPSVRELTERHTASPVTVQRALAQLVREGRVVTRPGDGSFVAQPPRADALTDVSWQSLALGASGPMLDIAATPFASARSNLIPLGTGYMDLATQPLALLRAAAQRVVRRDHIWSRGPAEGIEGLRAWFARDLGGDITPRQVLIVPGGQAGLSAVFRALLPAGAPLLFESPSYFGAILIARAAGIRPVPVPVDHEGMRPDQLDEALARSGARVVYLQPSYANPTGSLMSLSRRRELLEVVKRRGVFVVEDDYARDLCIDGSLPPPLVRELPSHVVYIRSLTKSAAPGLKIAAVCAMGPAFERLRIARSIDDWFVSGMLQETALELVTAAGWPRHLRALRSKLRARRDAALEALSEFLPGPSTLRAPGGGFNLWLPLPAHVDDVALAQAAERAGVHVNPGRACFPAEPVGPFLRLSYAAAEPAELREGVKILAGLLREQGG
jgi:DNA-binding transcriptional MocR family regulator